MLFWASVALICTGIIGERFERAKREKHVLNGATMIPLVMTTFGKLGPSAESYLQGLADVACSTGFVDRGVWLRCEAVSELCFGSGSCRGVMFRRYYKRAAKCAGKDYRDGAVVPFE